YLDSIRKVPNAIILNSSKWLNQVCIQTIDPAALAKINGFSFVKKTEAIAPAAAPGLPPVASLKFPKESGTVLGLPPVIAGVNGISVNYYDYGSSLGQVHIHEGEYLHNLGFRGEGMVIAVLDAGFLNFKTNQIFDSLRANNQILGEYDYVKNETSTNEDHPHGAWCLSVLAANKQGSMVGTAPKAKYWLLRTEDAATEFPIEEQNWAVAAEFADSVGADIITSSLGYTNFDNPAYNHTYAQRDGNTTIITRAADLAAKKGLLVTNSAGNDGDNGSDVKFVAAPADGDSVLTIGATDINGNIAGFSSWGPNGAGKLKPNVVSVGLNAIVASSGSGLPTPLNGTSFANPNLCGLVACLWQAFPEFSNMEIIDAVQKSANKFQTPDFRYGYGIPNMKNAFDILQGIRELRSLQIDQILGENYIKAYPVPFKNNLTLLLKAPMAGRANLMLINAAGATIETKTIDVQAGMVYTIEFSKAPLISNGVYTIYFTDGKNIKSVRVVRQ
ncbi:MAG: S8 family serine peptidase, partial [Gemmatimonadaceae bacterium]|nr:S8 family serine peptidase [Chitinophagaceae bacterium]